MICMENKEIRIPKTGMRVGDRVYIDGMPWVRNCYKGKEMTLSVEQMVELITNKKVAQIIYVQN